MIFRGTEFLQEFCSFTSVKCLIGKFKLNAFGILQLLITIHVINTLLSNDGQGCANRAFCGFSTLSSFLSSEYYVPMSGTNGHLVHHSRC